MLANDYGVVGVILSVQTMARRQHVSFGQNGSPTLNRTNAQIYQSRHHWKLVDARFLTSYYAVLVPNSTGALAGWRSNVPPTLYRRDLTTEGTSWTLWTRYQTNGE